MRMRRLATFGSVSLVVVACGSRADLLGDYAGNSRGDRVSGPDATVASVHRSAPDASTTSDPDAAADDAATLGTCVLVEGGTVRGEQADAAEVCTYVDAGAYDQSCTRSEDCTSIATGLQCNRECLCTDTAINVSGMPRYQQAVSCLPELGWCACPAEAVACCIRGRCTSTFARCPDWD